MGRRSVGQLRNLAEADGVYHLKDFSTTFSGTTVHTTKNSVITLIVKGETKTAQA